MKCKMILILIVLIFLIGCTEKTKRIPSDKEQDLLLLGNLSSQLRKDPDTTFPRCEELITRDAKHICYLTYLGLKIKKGEEVNSSFLDRELGEATMCYVELLASKCEKLEFKTIK